MSRILGNTLTQGSRLTTTTLRTVDDVFGTRTPKHTHSGLARHDLVFPGTIPRHASFMLTTLLAAIVRFAEPLALTSVFPYLPEMIKSFGVPDINVAKWAGLVGSTFSVAQSLSAILWGRLSDKIGRKPTILIGLVNVMFCFLIWGTSKSLVQAFISRFLMGLCNGNGTYPISVRSSWKCFSLFADVL